MRSISVFSLAPLKAGLVMNTCNPSAGIRDTLILRASQPIRPVLRRALGSERETSSKKVRWRAVLEDTWYQLPGRTWTHTSTYMHNKHQHVYTHMSAHTYIHIYCTQLHTQNLAILFDCQIYYSASPSFVNHNNVFCFPQQIVERWEVVAGRVTTDLSRDYRTATGCIVFLYLPHGTLTYFVLLVYWDEKWKWKRNSEPWYLNDIIEFNMLCRSLTFFHLIKQPIWEIPAFYFKTKMCLFT